MNEKHKIFVALELPAAIQELCSKVQDKLKDYGRRHEIPMASTKIIPREQLHCTVFPPVYLNDEQVRAFCKEVADFSFEPFEVTTSMVGYFGNGDIVWLGLESMAIADAVQELSHALHDLEFISPVKEREFIGHITLARRFEVAHLSHFLSEMNSDVDRYTFICSKLVCLESVMQDGQLMEYKKV